MKTSVAKKKAGKLQALQWLVISCLEQMKLICGTHLKFSTCKVYYNQAVWHISVGCLVKH